MITYFFVFALSLLDDIVCSDRRLSLRPSVPFGDDMSPRTDMTPIFIFQMCETAR